MLKKSWLFILPLVAGLMWVGAAPSQAVGETISIDRITATGCTSGDYTFITNRQGIGAGGFTVRTRVSIDGKLYMDEGVDNLNTDGDASWSLFDLFNYNGTPSNAGTWPMPANRQMQVRVTLEKPKGTVLDSWTLVTSGCNSTTIRYNGPTSQDVDNDLVPTAQDKCPTLKAFTENGCPVRGRSLSLAAKYSPKRVAGRLFSSGYPALYSHRTVYIWKVRPGPDAKVKTLTTTSLGKFAARVKKGRYYATSPGLIVPTSGQVGTSTSSVVRVR